MGYREVMCLPIRVFWLLNSNIGRLLAEKDLRELAIVTHSGSEESTRKIRETLIVEMGEVGSTEGGESDPMNAKRDQNGVDELKALAAMM